MDQNPNTQPTTTEVTLPASSTTATPAQLEGLQKTPGRSNKTKIIGLGVTILLIFGLGIFVSHRSSKKTDETLVIPTPQETLPTVDSSVEITLTSKDNSRAVVLHIAKFPADVTTVDYELTYDTASGLPRGVLGRIEVKGEKEIEREILLGTCSKNKCVYDEGVKKVSLVLKFNTPSGSSQFQKEYPL